MNKELFLALYKAIKEAYDPKILYIIIDILQEAGYGHYHSYRTGECYDRDVETVNDTEYGDFLVGYAREIQSYRFDA